MRALFALRDVRVLFAGQALSLLGDTALSLAMGIWVKDLTGSSSAAGLVFLAFVAPQLLSPAAGLLVDRVRRRPLLLAVNLLTALAVLPLLLVGDAGDSWVIYVVMVLYGASNVVLAAGQSALLTTLVPPDLLGHGNAAMQTLREGMRLLGPLTGAALFTWAGGGAIAVLDALTFLAAAASLGALGVREPAPAAVTHDVMAELTAGLRHLAGHPRLRPVVLACAVGVGAFGLSEAAMFAVNDDLLGRPPAFIGVLVAVQGVGAIVSGPLTPRLIERVGEARTTAVGMGLAALAMATFTIPSVAAALAGMVLLGASLPPVVAAPVTLLQRATPAALQGRAFAAFELAVSVPQAAAIAGGAALVALLDVQLLLAVVTALLIAATVSLTRADRLVEQGRGGGGDVQGLDLPAQRQADEAVAG